MIEKVQSDLLNVPDRYCFCLVDSGNLWWFFLFLRRVLINTPDYDADARLCRGPEPQPVAGFRD